MLNMEFHVPMESRRPSPFFMKKVFYHDIDKDNRDLVITEPRIGRKALFLVHLSDQANQVYVPIDCVQDSYRKISPHFCTYRSRKLFRFANLG